MGYAVLRREALGAYTASAVLPKGIFTLTLPIVQVMFASIVGREDGRGAATMAKTLAMVVSLTVAGAIVIVLGRDAACGGEPWRIGTCEPDLLMTMAFAIAPISLLRCLVAMKLAGGALFQPAWLLLPVAGFAAYSFRHVATPNELAEAFNVAVYGALVFYAGLCAIGWKRQDG